LPSNWQRLFYSSRGSGPGGIRTPGGLCDKIVQTWNLQTPIDTYLLKN
jgi:hypothetical protein